MDHISKNVDILWMSRFHYKKNSDLAIHEHLYYQLFYFFEGSSRLFLDGTWITLSCPSILLISPNTEHGLDVSEGLKTMDIKFTLKNQKAREQLKGICGLSGISEWNNIEKLLEELLVIGTQKKSLFRERCHLVLSVILLQLMSEKMDEGDNHLEARLDQNALVTKSPLCNSLVDYIAENLDKKIDSDSIEAAMGYTYRHTSLCTSRELHMSPMQLVRSLRIQKAKELITNNYDLKLVASKTGFQSIYHFTRIFKQQVGLPPGAWKDQQIRDICRGIEFVPGFTSKWNNRELKTYERGDKHD